MDFSSTHHTAQTLAITVMKKNPTPTYHLRRITSDLQCPCPQNTFGDFSNKSRGEPVIYINHQKKKKKTEQKEEYGTILHQRTCTLHYVHKLSVLKLKSLHCSAVTTNADILIDQEVTRRCSLQYDWVFDRKWLFRGESLAHNILL